MSTQNPEKLNSTIGRMTIYNVSLSLISENNILTGIGISNFPVKYMKQQATYLTTQSEEVKMLADNIRHPQNEFILILIECGLSGLLYVGSIIWFLFKKSNLEGKLIINSIMILCLFSYPLHYPVVWLYLVLAASNNYCHGTAYPTVDAKNYHIVLKAIAIVIILIDVNNIKNIVLWDRAHSFFVTGQYVQSRQLYERIPISMSSEYLYNYAYFLLSIGDIETAYKLTSNHNKIDYEFALLKANIAYEYGRLDEAVYYYQQAFNMCPNRFVPLYGLFKVGKAANDSTLINQTRNAILSKRIKVPSLEIERIINKVKET